MDVQRVLSRIPPNSRRAFVANELDGKSYAEIAASEGVSVAVVRKRMAKAYEIIARERWRAAQPSLLGRISRLFQKAPAAETKETR